MSQLDTDIIGPGGVASGKDAFELILCGAKAVQVGTCHWTDGSGCFARIAGELVDIMQKKGCDSIENFIWKLKPYMKHPNNFNRKNVKADILDSEVSFSTSPAENLSFSQSVIALLTLVVAYLIADKNGILVPLVF